MKKVLLALVTAIGVWIFGFGVGVSLAEEAKKGIELSGWVDKIYLSGDLRLRYDATQKDPDPDRHRFRFRLRFGSDIEINDLIVGIRLASGTGEQVSTNQSFDSLFSQKEIWIDRAYLQWKGPSWLRLTGGKMPNPFFTIFTTGMIWDDDINPEGFAQNLSYKSGDNLTAFINLGQFILDEDKTDNNDQFLFGEQAGIKTKLAKDLKLNLALAYYDAVNTREGDFGQDEVQSGNSRVSSTDPTLLNDYNVLDLTVELATVIGTHPVSLQGDCVKNLADTTTGEDIGYNAGFIIGKASDPHTWEVAYFYKLIETDAALADLSDSDFGDGGINRKGHILWGSYNLTKALQFKIRYIRTEVENRDLPPNDSDINRLLTDVSIKF